MRVRSEWITIFTVTSLVVCGLALPKTSGPSPADNKRKDIAANGVDFMPVGTTRAPVVAKAYRHPQSLTGPAPAAERPRTDQAFRNAAIMASLVRTNRAQGPFRANALTTDARTFQQQGEGIGQQLRLRDPGCGAERHQALPIGSLALLDDAARRVIDLRELHRSIGQRTSAAVRQNTVSALGGPNPAGAPSGRRHVAPLGPAMPRRLLRPRSVDTRRSARPSSRKWR